MDAGLEFSHYRIVEHIGRGGMADVWSARDKRLNRTVAVKTMVRDLSPDTDPMTQFVQEAKTIASLEHPHILPIYDFGDVDGQLYIVMRYVSGGSIENLVEEGPLNLDEVLRFGRNIAQALDHAHANNIIHLDLKPSNILLDANQSPYLADFGLAAWVGPEGRAANPGSGTLLYMAPEQLTSDQLDHRADIYSFTVMLFHMLTGQLPFDATTPLALKQLQFREGLPEIDLVSPNLPVGLTEILRLGTAIEPDERPNRASELINEFEKVLRPGGRTTAELAGIEADVLTSDADLSDLITEPSSGPEAQARREAMDIYSRARRAWAHGQGRFLLGVTHFMLISDFYMAAERYGLEVDEAGRQMLLRGAIEYDHEIEFWWNHMDDESRRWVALHAVRSENAPARVRALRLLQSLPDADMPVIPKQVAQALQNESNIEAMLAAIDTLMVRAKLAGPRLDIRLPRPERKTSRTTQVLNRITTQLHLAAPDVWQEVIFSAEIDRLLADIALTSPYAEVAERAARSIGRIHSLSAVREIASQQRKGMKGALRALAFVRDEAPSLPPEVSDRGRLYAWLANTWRRLTQNPLQNIWRFLYALLGGFLAIGLNTYITFRGEAIFSPARWSNTIAIGLTTGVLIAFVVMVADEFPARLRGFWPWWARLLLSAGLGSLAGILVWAGYTYMFLETVPDDWGVIAFAGIGLALGFIANSMLALPGWMAVIVTTVTTYLPLYMAFQNFNTVGSAAILYYDYPNQIFYLTLPLALLIALGGHAQAILRDVRGWFQQPPRVVQRRVARASGGG